MLVEYSQDFIRRDNHQTGYYPKLLVELNYNSVMLN